VVEGGTVVVEGVAVVVVGTVVGRRVVVGRLKGDTVAVDAVSGREVDAAGTAVVVVAGSVAVVEEVVAIDSRSSDDVPASAHPTATTSSATASSAGRGDVVRSCVLRASIVPVYTGAMRSHCTSTVPQSIYRLAVRVSPPNRLSPPDPTLQDLRCIRHS
jgi:hypothetical protein